MKKAANYWLIEGYDSLQKFYERKVAVGVLPNIVPALQALAAKAGLSDDEIVSAYCKKRTRMHNGLLEVNHDALRRQYMCGENPYFIARVVSVETDSDS